MRMLAWALAAGLWAAGLFVAGPLAAEPAAAAAKAPAGFVFGADLSFGNEMADCGAVYRDEGGVRDLYDIFRAHGTNLVRIRLWHRPGWTKYSTLTDVERSIRRAKAAGMKVLLDFHYADDWADGDKQPVPAAWADLRDPELTKALYDYTYDTLTRLDAEGLMPDMVQTGNETNVEMLLPGDGRPTRPLDWTRNAALLNVAISAVRAAGAKSAIRPAVMLHIAQPENVEGWIAAAIRAGVTDFDVIGISYYPKWSKFSLAGLTGTINRLRHRYPGVPVMVAETAYAWTQNWADGQTNVLGADGLLRGYPATRDGQKRFLVDLTQAVISGGGSGVIYWAPDWISTACRTRWGSGSTWENATLFDFAGAALPALDYPQADYVRPVTVTFRFAGAVPAAGSHFLLWGDFFGARDIAVRLPDGAGKMEYAAELMPGQSWRLQVFADPALSVRLLSGPDGFAAGVAPAQDATLELRLTPPS